MRRQQYQSHNGNRAQAYAGSYEGRSRRNENDYSSPGNSYRNHGRNSRYGNYDSDIYENEYDHRGYSTGNYRHDGDSYGNRNYGGRSQNRNFWERAGDKIKDTWNNMTNRDDRQYNNYGRDPYHRSSRPSNERNYGGYNSGRNSNYGWDRYQTADEYQNNNYRGSRNWEHDRNYSENEYYNPNSSERDYDHDVYAGTFDHDDDYNRHYRGSNRSSNNYSERPSRGSSDRSYDYYESYPSYGHSQRNGNNYRDSQRRRINDDDRYNSRRRSSPNSNWSNAYTPISEYQ